MPGARVTVASRTGEPIEADGLIFSGISRLAGIEQCDVLCVPGGMGATEAALDADFLGEIRRLAADARFVTSVCTGSLILGAAGLLHSRRAACHWAWRDLLEPFGAIPDERRVVIDGNIVTGGGVTAGIDLALTVAAEVAGAEVAQAIQLGIEYAPAPPFGAGRPETAPEAVREAVERRLAPMLDQRRAEVERAAAALADGAHE